MKSLLFSCVALLMSCSSAFGQVELPATADNSIVLVDGEWSENAGESARIRIKGNQHIVAIDFDVSAIRGRRVKRVELIAFASAETISAVSISTIATPWNETRSNGLTAGIDSVEGWGYAGGLFPAVCGGNGFTLVDQASSPIEAEKYRWEIDPDLVHALAIGAAHGLAIHEHDADYSRNPTIYSREQSGKRPVLLVELADESDPLPEAVAKMQLIPVDRTSALLNLTGPSQGFAYEVTINDEPVARHNIPFVESGVEQTIYLRDLPGSVTSSAAHVVKVVTLNRTGDRSSAAEMRGELFGDQPIAFPQDQSLPGRKSSISGLSVIPCSDKYDRQGNSVGELPANHRSDNRLFDGQTIRLRAAAGEVIGFQAVLRAMNQKQVDVEVSFENWTPRIDLFRAIYVASEGRQIPDPLVSIEGPIELSANEDQSVFVDIYVPFGSSPMVHQGELRVSDGRALPIELEILPFEIPRKASFLCEMNSYGLPDHVDDYYALQQVAYDHRVHCNILHYSHNTAAPGSRKSNLDMRLRSGRRMDNRRYDGIEPGATRGFWDDFAEAFGPYLDGSCFAQGHRGPIAAPGFYLTFHESWPLNCRAYFNGNLDAYQAFADHPVYAQTYTDILADFARVANEQGWHDARFQVYFNNKGSLNEPTKAPWILDEPSAFWDYRALQYYGELSDAGIETQPSVSIDYRIDISRPEFCRGQLDGRSDLWVVSSWAFQHYRRLVTDRIAEDQLKAWVYGTSNPVHESNRQTYAWAIDAWSHGAVGLVPWQTVDKTGNALKEADQLGLFIFDQDSSGKTVIRHSTRLIAYREAEQLIEYLVLLREKQGWTESQMREFIAHYVPLVGRVDKLDEADAGTARYDAESLMGFDALRQATITLLSSE